MIKKELKFASFQYNEDTNIFTVWNDSEGFMFNKIYAFAFIRFVLRVAQRNWFRRKKARGVVKT
jgi:hypothetical protein